VTFFFDNNLPLNAAKILQLVEYNVVHFQEVYPHEQHPEGVKDIVWIPEIGKRGWAIVAADQRILTRPAEALALKKANVIAYFIYRGFPEQGIVKQARWMIRHWEEIEEHAEKTATPGNSYEVRSDGKIKPTQRGVRPHGNE
jgi:PIN domain-containing protein